jgi:hypothetical protein
MSPLLLVWGRALSPVQVERSSTANLDPTSRAGAPAPHLRGLDKHFPILGSHTNQTAPLLGGAALLEVRGRSGLGLERLHVFRLEAFGAIHQVELHGLAFLQAAESVCPDGRKMHEDVCARVAADKAVAFGVVKPLHCSLFHCVTYFCF